MAQKEIVRDYHDLDFGEFCAKYGVQRGTLPGDEIFAAIEAPRINKEVGR